MKGSIMAACGASLLFVGCAVEQPEIGQQVVIERVPESRPGWVTTVPADRGNTLYFVGMKTHASSLENGNTDARQAAIQKIVEYLGGTGKVDYTKARVEAGVTDEGQAGNYVEDGYRFLAESVAKGAREEESYYERVKERHVDGWHHFYNYYVLIGIRSDELTRAAGEAFEQQAAQARARNDQRAEAFANELKRQVTGTPAPTGR